MKFGVKIFLHKKKTVDFHYFPRFKPFIFSNDILKMDSSLKHLKSVIHNQITKVSFYIYYSGYESCEFVVQKFIARVLKNVCL